MDGNAETLRRAGLVANTALPGQYERIVNGLTQQEVDVLIGLKRRLDEAGVRTAPLGAQPSGRLGIVRRRLCDQSIVIL